MYRDSEGCLSPSTHPSPSSSPSCCCVPAKCMLCLFSNHSTDYPFNRIVWLTIDYCLVSFVIFLHKWRQKTTLPQMMSKRPRNERNVSNKTEYRHESLANERKPWLKSCKGIYIFMERGFVVFGMLSHGFYSFLQNGNYIVQRKQGTQWYQCIS